MRFHGEHIATLLPCLFEEHEYNKKFIEEQTLTTKMKQMFDDAIVDNNFDRLYHEMSNFDPDEQHIKDVTAETKEQNEEERKCPLKLSKTLKQELEEIVNTYYDSLQNKKTNNASSILNGMLCHLCYVSCIYTT